ncbi:hypothetical protein HS088_TW06G00655 [Tripterygium wilfordii]|uniref:Uncharacterized protein n=1 Tax=Tripterygium wilfordii TaxID=458696 RepID=A0A7J7DJR3_TRIWF|nr:uncharacterized protein LOC120000735 [Tripterygium wilfordii]XP_038704781.1 uncharacterized protein LOC120000735 [Tripterygium wilfordii]KAF5746484.1 hypothetical protein HS088_TW06G00655 [Tripterygium wilfordii]
MGDNNIEVPQPPLQTPLLQESNLSQENHHQQEVTRDEGTDLDRNLRRLETFLTFLGFNQSSPLSFILSWTVFVLVGVVLPIVILELPNCEGCDEYQIKDFELDIVASQACLAAVSLICLSHNLRKYGIRKFLFVDRSSGHMDRLRNLYIRQISESMRLLIWGSVPCFILKVSREVIRGLYIRHESWWQSVAILLGLILSWTYVSAIFLTASTLFHLVCNLQVIHFDDYAKLLERESDVLVLMEEHIRLRYHLSKISHRFRIYLLLEFVVVTASLFMTLFQTTGYSGIITAINGGDFAVSSVVQVIGIIISLHAATKISHRAQNIASLASRWHALAACCPADASQLRTSNSAGNIQAASLPNLLHINYSESDLESLDYVSMPTDSRLISYMSSYYKRHAFVIYLQMNPGGITIFGWTVDRGLLNTIFFLELTLVTFVLGKTIILSTT